MTESGKFATEHYCNFVNETWTSAANKLERVHRIMVSEFSDDGNRKAEARFLRTFNEESGSNV